MKWTMRYAALLAALVLALGLVGVMRPSAAAADDPVEIQPPPSNKGDPDSGGTSRFLTFGWIYWNSSLTRTLSFLGLSPVTRRGVNGYTSARWQAALTRAARR